MKKILLTLLIVVGMGCCVNAQSTTTSYDDVFKNMKLTAKDTLVFQYMNAYLSQLREPRFQLFKTQNMWTFLKLDTMTGQIWQVQFSVNGNEYRFTVPLDINERIIEDFDEPICGRFTLYATENMYNFMLLDQIDGRCWQVQWSTDYENRGVMRIY